MASLQRRPSHLPGAFPAARRSAPRRLRPVALSALHILWATGSSRPALDGEAISGRAPGHGQAPSPPSRSPACWRLLRAWAFALNEVWLEIVLLAHDLIVWTQALALDGELAKAEPKRLRYRLLRIAGRLAFHGRRAKLRLQHDWPWAEQLHVPTRSPFRVGSRQRVRAPPRGARGREDRRPQRLKGDADDRRNLARSRRRDRRANARARHVARAERPSPGCSPSCSA